MVKITYGIHDSPFGDMVVGITHKGVCWIGFMCGGYKGDGLYRMREFFPEDAFQRDDGATRKTARDIIDAWAQDRLHDIPLDLKGTPFQLSVWNALLNIPKGEVRSYRDIAEMVGNSKAMRAVGSAVGENPVSLIVPCHRVVQSSGQIGNYGWGPALKQRLLEMEQEKGQVLMENRSQRAHRQTAA